MTDFQGKEGRASLGEEAGAPRELHMDLGAVETDHVDAASEAATSFAPDALEGYRDAGYELIPLRGPNKLPLRGWRTLDALTLDQARRRLNRGSNVGVRPAEDDLVIDVDPKNFPDGADSWELLKRDVAHDFDFYPTVVTGSGGQHVYMRKPAGLRVRGTLKAYPGIDFKKAGGFVVSAGSTHPRTGKPYRWEPLSMPLRDVAAAPQSLTSFWNLVPPSFCLTVRSTLSAMPRDISQS
jgi:hypothetical protein